MSEPCHAFRFKLLSGQLQLVHGQEGPVFAQLAQFCGQPTEACSAGCIEVDGQEAKIYEIEPGVIRATGAEKLCPRDHRKGAAYVDAIDADAVGRATMMLSYTWNYTVRDIVEGLVEYCDTAGLEEGSTYVWICCLCISACC